MEAKLTGFDLMMFIARGSVQVDLDEDGIEIFVEDLLAESLAEMTGVKVSSEQLTRVYEKYLEIVSGISLTLTEAQGEDV